MGKRDDAIARYVIAIGELMDAYPIGFVLEDDTGNVVFVCPQEQRFEALDLMRHTNWSNMYDEAVRAQDDLLPS